MDPRPGRPPGRGGPYAAPVSCQVPATPSYRHSSAATSRAYVTIHAYSPPLWRSGAYEILPGGGLRRHSMSDPEELRPI
jgi:hypothetical protein